jgi:hypothetical protein
MNGCRPTCKSPRGLRCPVQRPSVLTRGHRDHLYFDRVHPVIPLLHRGLYFTSPRQAERSEAQVALQLAMRTLAAASSAPYQQLSGSLYAETRRTLEKLDNEAEEHFVGEVAMEHIQAWLLLAHYDFMHMPRRRAIMTSGRVFRMVQVALLHQIDQQQQQRDAYVTSGGVQVSTGRQWIAAEERRRAFWVAYCLDRCVSLYTGCPLTFHEDVVREILFPIFPVPPPRIRVCLWPVERARLTQRCVAGPHTLRQAHIQLPASETQFENGQSGPAEFLPKAVASSGQRASSSFAEYVILLTLWTRHKALRPGVSADAALTHIAVTGDVSEQQRKADYERLAAVTQRRHARLSEDAVASDVQKDPLLLLNRLIAAVILLCVLGKMSHSNLADPSSSSCSLKPARACALPSLAWEVVRLGAETLAQLSHFKASPVPARDH